MGIITIKSKLAIGVPILGIRVVATLTCVHVRVWLAVHSRVPVAWRASIHGALAAMHRGRLILIEGRLRVT